jgi:hypothetical protein
MKSNFWIYNREKLLSKQDILNFIPLISMTLEEKINSITRLSLYLSIILSIMTCNLNYIYIFVGTIVLTYIFYIFTVKHSEKSVSNAYFNNVIKNSEINSEDIVFFQ